MATLLLDHLRSVFTASAVGELARAVGENTAPTQKAVDGLIPAVTAGVINRAQTNEGAATLYRLLTNTPFASDPSLDQLVDTDSHRQKAAQSGNTLLDQLFTDRPQRLAASTAEYSGVKPGAATTLTGLVMSILMGFLHKQVTTRNLTEAQLATLLRGESDTARGAVPAALAGLLGWFIGTGTSRPVTTTTIRPETVSRPTDDRTGGTPWWRWLLYILIPLLLLFLLLRSCNGDKAETTTTSSASEGAVATDTVASDNDGNELAPTQGDSTRPSADAAGPSSPGPSSPGPEVRVGVDLPGGRKLNLAENSFNYTLAKFLATKGGQVPKVFTFDNLTFETNSARITTQARPNVDDLIQIMQSYPTLQIRIEGNTDSTGDDAINDPLSGERADAVKQALIKGGIDASRIATRERGDTKPVATNETQAGRQKNRRIDVVVTKV
jgi:outer membrane protein OmpA-like peptidoglycan-associated protein